MCIKDSYILDAKLPKYFNFFKHNAKKSIRTMCEADTHYYIRNVLGKEDRRYMLKNILMYEKMP